MPRLAEQMTVDFSQGMYDSVAPTRYPRAAVAQLLNARIEPDGTAKRRPGSIRTHSSALEVDTCYGATAFRKADGTDQIVAIFGGKAYYSTDEGATWTTITTGLRGDYYDFATMRVGATNYLFLANGDTTIKSWDGANWSTVSNAPSGVKYIAVFNGRLYATGHSGVIVQASKIGDPDTWASPDGLTVQIIVHSGNTPTGLFQVGPHLLVFDEEATSYIDGFGEQTLITATGATGFSRSVGCVAFRTIVGVGDNGVAWLSRRGVEYYATGGGIALVSRPIQDFMQDLDWEQIYSTPGLPSACYDEIDQNLHLAVTTNGVRNNRVLVLNLRQGNVEYQRKGARAAASIDSPLGASTGELLFGGDANGYLTVVEGGYPLRADDDGYASLDTELEGGDEISGNSDGYLETVSNITVPSTLFTAPISTRPSVVFSGGYDGFLRKHYGVSSDDLSSDESGGATFGMTLRSKPFLFRRPRQRKRVRAIHVASIQDAAATITARIRGQGTTSAPKTLSMVARGASADRAMVRTSFRADAPQVELQTSDDVRISLIGVSAEPLRERL